MDEITNDGPIIWSYNVDHAKAKTTAETRRFIFKAIFDATNTRNTGNFFSPDGLSISKRCSSTAVF